MCVIIAQAQWNEIRRHMLCQYKQIESGDAQNAQLSLEKAQLVATRKLLDQELSSSQAQSALASRTIEDLTKQQEALRKAAEIATKEAAERDELKRKRDALDDLETKLRNEKRWGEEMSAGRPLLMGAGAIAGGPVGFLAATCAGYAYELFKNRKKHFNKSYFKDLFDMQVEAKSLSRQVGRSYPDDLEKAWWNQKQSLVHGFFGRDFGFQHKYQK